MLIAKRKTLAMLAPANTTEATLLTVGAGKQVELNLFINNVTGTAANVTVKLVSGGVTVSLRTAVSLAANATNDAAPIKLFLSAGDKILVTSGTANAIAFVASGIEYSAS
jgi:hypothetical protein